MCVPRDPVPLPGEERGLLTLPWSGLPAGQDSALTLISLSLNDSEVAREKERQHTCIKKGVDDEEKAITVLPTLSEGSSVWISVRILQPAAGHLVRIF